MAKQKFIKHLRSYFPNSRKELSTLITNSSRTDKDLSQRETERQRERWGGPGEDMMDYFLTRLYQHFKNMILFSEKSLTERKNIFQKCKNTISYSYVKTY